MWPSSSHPNARRWQNDPSRPHRARRPSSRRTLESQSYRPLSNSYDVISEDADSLDFGFDDIAVFQKFLRRAPESDAFGRPGRDDVARFERHAPRQHLDDGVHSENHVRGCRVLFLHAVDARADFLCLRIAEFVRGDDNRTHRTEAVEALALEPLQMPHL